NRAEGGKYPVGWPNTRPGINHFWAPEKQRGARAQQLNPRSGILVLDRGFPPLVKRCAAEIPGRNPKYPTGYFDRVSRPGS
ncbi:unnamed protein product, partial [Linum tenue]